jgi:predicted ATP-dependent Lon-type protease
MNSSNRGTTMDQLDEKLLSLFPGKVVRKDIAQPLKNEFNVPAYVAE